MSYDTFVSYNRKDLDQVSILVSYLGERVGLQVWMDRGLLIGGDPWRQRIEEAMNSSASCLVVHGKHGPGPVQQQEEGLVTLQP